MIGNCLEINCLEMFGNSVILWWQDHVLGHLSYLPPHALYKIRILLDLQWNFQLWLRMARDRLVILRWAGNDWKLFGHFFDFIVVGCGGVKCKVKLEPLEISSHLL